MSYKRSRTTFEDDKPHAPFAVFGTPLPDEADRRDDGAYKPVWQQEVRDERGRKRLHGAFTGGFSAGYFNTVGSKEGWTPSTFVSSRTNRRKDDAKQPQHRPEDYMDDEDLEDAAEAQKLSTDHAFAGLGASSTEEQTGGLVGMFRPSGDTTGMKLLRKMGWKDGQGIGARVRRSARLDSGTGNAGSNGETHLFAPDNVPMIRFTRKTDRKGLGHSGEAKLSGLHTPKRNEASDDEEAEDGDMGSSSIFATKPKPKVERRGIGVGVLNDDGSDEEDPYEIGPKIRYNRTIGGDKKKKTKKAAAVNPALKKAPVFMSKAARGGNSFRRCHDGKLPLEGYSLAQVTEDFANLFSKYAPPPVPAGWASAKTTKDTNGAKSTFVSTADAAKTSSLDPRSRAALLGEKALPGKSVFDFLSASARDQLAAGSGKQNLPQAKGEVPAGYETSAEDREAALMARIPQLDRETAIAVLARSAGGPYADDEDKRARYRAYVEHFANPSRPIPTKSSKVSESDYIKEMTEFYNCAKIFKPMTGFMASRFATAKSTTTLPGSDGTSTGKDLITKPEPEKAKDPAEAAAEMGMFGRLTRSTQMFYPTRLLCKRFNVRPPDHAQADGESKATAQPETKMEESAAAAAAAAAPQLAIMDVPKPAGPVAEEEKESELVIDPEKNEAVEGTAAHAEVLKAIFGDSDSE